MLSSLCVQSCVIPNYALHCEHTQCLRAESALRYLVPPPVVHGQQCLRMRYVPFTYSCRVNLTPAESHGEQLRDRGSLMGVTCFSVSPFSMDFILQKSLADSRRRELCHEIHFHATAISSITIFLPAIDYLQTLSLDIATQVVLVLTDESANSSDRLVTSAHIIESSFLDHKDRGTQHLVWERDLSILVHLLAASLRSERE
nr:hypothetical protein Iba_chr13aCG14190 [Ipomoea batatas]